MRATLNDKRELAIDLEDVLRNFTAEEKRTLADSLACFDDVIKDVADQIVKGWTDTTSHGLLCCTAGENPSTGLDYAMRLVAKNSGDVAKKEIERMEDALRRANAEIRDLYEQLHRRHE